MRPTVATTTTTLAALACLLPALLAGCNGEAKKTAAARTKYEKDVAPFVDALGKVEAEWTDPKRPPADLMISVGSAKMAQIPLAAAAPPPDYPSYKALESALDAFDAAAKNVESYRAKGGGIRTPVPGPPTPEEEDRRGSLDMAFQFFSHGAEDLKKGRQLLAQGQ